MNLEIINADNYEAFWLDYLEGDLSAGEEKRLLDWLEKHPQYKEELEEDLPVLSASTEEFMGKHALYKTTAIQGEDIDDVLIASVEEILPQEEEQALKEEVKQKEWLQKELKYYQATKLQPEMELTFAEKETLKKRGVLIPLAYKWMGAAAAAVVAGMVFFTPISSEKNYEPRADVAVNSVYSNVASDNITIAEAFGVVVDSSEEKEESSSVKEGAINRQDDIGFMDGERGNETDYPNIASSTSIHLDPLDAKRVAHDDFNFAYLELRQNKDEWFMASGVEASSRNRKGLFKSLGSWIKGEESFNDSMSGWLAMRKDKIKEEVDKSIRFEKDLDKDSKSSWALAIGPLYIKHNRYK